MLLRTPGSIGMARCGEQFDSRQNCSPLLSGFRVV